MSERKNPRAPWRNFYGRTKGKGLRDSQQAYLDEDLAGLSPGPVDWDANPERTPLDLAALFGGREVWLEIGFGGGEHLVHQAARNPGIGLIGCEPYINGVAMLLGKIRTAGVTNLAVHPGDVRDLFDVLPDASIAKAFLLYPDPWPKTRHHRRRFVTPDYLRRWPVWSGPGPSFAWRRISPITCARRWNRCPRTASNGSQRGRMTGAPPGRTGCRPATSKRPCVRVACRIT